MNEPQHRIQVAIIKLMSAAEAPVLFSQVLNELGETPEVRIAMMDLIGEGLIASCFPHARDGASGLQYWTLA